MADWKTTYFLMLQSYFLILYSIISMKIHSWFFLYRDNLTVGVEAQEAVSSFGTLSKYIRVTAGDWLHYPSNTYNPISNAVSIQCRLDNQLSEFELKHGIVVCWTLQMINSILLPGATILKRSNNSYDHHNLQEALSFENEGKICWYDDRKVILKWCKFVI